MKRYNKLYAVLTTINLNKFASKLSLFMSVARKTPKFADSSREEKWEKPIKKKSSIRSEEYDYQDKENIDSSSNIPTSYSDRNWDQNIDSNSVRDLESTRRSSKGSQRGTKDEKKKKVKERREEPEIKEIEEEDDEDYSFIKTSLPRHKNTKKQPKEIEEDETDFQETKKNPYRKSSRLKFGGESMDLSEIASNYYNQDFDKHINKLKNLGRSEEDDQELETSELKDSTRRIKENLTKELKKTKTQIFESPSSSKFTDSLKKELKSNVERVRSMKKGSYDGLSEFSEGSVSNLSRRLSTNRQTPTSKAADISFEKINKMKRANSKNKLEVQGKIDFINSMFEELSLTSKDDPKPSAKPKKPKPIEEVEIIERPPREIQQKEAPTKNQKSKRKPLKERHEEIEEEEEEEAPPQEIRSQKRSSRDIQDSKRKPKVKEVEPEPEIDEEEEIEIKSKMRRSSRKPERIEAVEDLQDSEPKRIFARKGSLPKISELEFPPESLETPSNNKLENKLAKKNKPPAQSSVKKEVSKPPLPVKKEEEQDLEEEENGYEEPIPSASDKHPLASVEKRTGPKNFIEMNKSVVDATKKLHKSYEKVLLNFDQSIKPMLSSIQKKTQFSPARQKLLSPGRSIKSPSPSNRSLRGSIMSSSPFRENPAYDLACQGFINSAASIQQFYQVEIGHLTQKITEAANVMQKTLEQIESFRKNEEPLYSVKGSARKRYSSRGDRHQELESCKRSQYREEEEEEEDEEQEEEHSDYSDSN